MATNIPVYRNGSEWANQWETGTKARKSGKWVCREVNALTALYQAKWEAAVGTDKGAVPRMLCDPGVKWDKVAEHAAFWTKQRDTGQSDPKLLKV